MESNSFKKRKEEDEIMNNSIINKEEDIMDFSNDEIYINEGCIPRKKTRNFRKTKE